MAGSRLNALYTAQVILRQFAMAAEGVTYVDETGATIGLSAVVSRDPANPPSEVRENDGVYEIERATLTVLPIVDATFGGIVLDTATKIAAFKGRNFSVAVIEGGTLIPDWIVKSVTGSTGTWELGVSREKRVETGKTRRGSL